MAPLLSLWIHLFEAQPMMARDVVKNKIDAKTARKRQKSFISPDLKMWCSSLELHGSYRLTLYIQLYTKNCR